jgi:ATP-binding cassette subfamily B protein
MPALAAVGALDWALGLPEGLETPAEALGADGRQLVALARVALTDPAAVVLDEATSALDPAAERRLEEAMRGVLAGRAVLVIAHRPGTAARCDRVLHLDGGRLREA